MIGKLSIIFVLLATVLMTAVCADSGPADLASQITVVFRYDDYSSRSATSVEQNIFELFAEHRLALTVGVIPYICAGSVRDSAPQELIALTPDKAETLRQFIRRGTVNAALHGYAHQSNRDYGRGKPSEFVGSDFHSQLLKLKEGKVFLETSLEAPLDTFIPPWSTYDANTLLALEKLDFKCLSGVLSGYSNPTTQLKFLPATCELTEARQTLTYALRIAAYSPLVCVVFHEYDFKAENNAGVAGKEDLRYQELVDLVRWIKAQKNMRVCTIDQLVQSNMDLSVDRFNNNKYYIRLAHLKPAFWPPYYGVYAPSYTAHSIRMTNIFKDININRFTNIFFISSFYLVILGISAGITFLLGLLIFKIFPPPYYLYKLLNTSCILVFLFFILYLILVVHIRYMILIPLVTLEGIIIGLHHCCPAR